MKNERLMPLREMSDYKVAKDSTDVMGWRVVGADGETLGTVKDMIVDAQLLKVRYLSILADNRFFNTDKDQHTLIPIGAAALDKRGKNVFVSYLDSKTIGSYPVYTGERISDEYEYAIRDSIQKSQNAILPETSETYRQEFNESVSGERTENRPISNDFYENDAYDANRFYTSDQELDRDRTYTSNDQVLDRDRTYTSNDQELDRDRTYTTNDQELNRDTSRDTSITTNDQEPKRETIYTTRSNYDRTDSTNNEFDSDRTESRDVSSGRSKSVEDSIATIERLEGLRKRGSITEEEFILMKKRALDL